ncbi:MAG: M17 family peptidase N-terminal domain-containing protein [Edaphobacter sp.]
MKDRHWPLLLAAIILLLGYQAICPAQSLAPPKVTVLVKSPAETSTELQIFCLFNSTQANALHGSLTEIDEKLRGLLTQIRTPSLFNGDLGETLLFTPPPGTIAAKKVLVIGLGDSKSFTPARMYLVGKIAFREANRLGIAHPFFAPTILDGGVTGISTGDVAEQFVHGVRDALQTESSLREKGSSGPLAVQDFTFLAGPTHAADTQAGISIALGQGSSAPR